MKNKKNCICFLFMLIFFMIFIIISFFTYEDKSKFETFKLGRNRYFDIYISHSWELTQPLYYQVRENGKILQELNFLYSSSPENIKNLKLDFLATPKVEMAAIVSMDSPKKIYIIYDFKEKYGGYKKKLLIKFEKYFPKTKFSFAY